jgi:hypothetical protein
MPANLEEDWREISLVQWFARGWGFRWTTERWDVKCTGDGKFFRLGLRPNLGLRNLGGGEGERGIGDWELGGCLI